MGADRQPMQEPNDPMTTADAETSTGTRAASRARKFAPLAVLAAVALAFVAFGGLDYVSFERLAENRDALRGWTGANPVLAGLVYAAVYAAATAASLPIGTVLTLAGGFVFGTWFGGALTVAAASLGATLIFLAARSALADYFEARLGDVARRMRDRFADNAFAYILALRLAPIFPFVVVNVAPALVGVRLVPYVAATMIGIIPGTFVYASVGAGLDAIIAAGEEPDLAIVFKPEVLIPLLLLATLAVAPTLWRRFSNRR